MEISVIISTYNSPAWLRKVLLGYECQKYKQFEVIIADDGSGKETEQLIREFQERGNLNLHHVWHKDDGFRKTEILNLATLQSSTDYLLFTDGDCIPRNDFLEVHINKRKANHFLSGGYFKLPMKTSELISEKEILSQECFDVNWLTKNGLKRSYKQLKLTASGFQESFLNQITPTKATWNGHNASGWKKDILAVNGHDERMKYGGEDRELGERLMNLGIKPIQIRYSAICIHLDHSRSYISEEHLTRNKNIRKETKINKATYTPFGIKKTNKIN